MQNKIKNIIVLGIVILVISAITVTAALVTSANNITFSSDKTDKTSVKEALDELYLLNNNNSSSSYYGVLRNTYSTTSAWERIGLSIGLEANAQIGTTEVKNDFDSIYPWSEIKSYNYDTDSQSITAWYGDENFTFTPEGNVEVLTYIPEFYYKRAQIDGIEYVLISKEAQDGFTKSEAFSIGRYTMSGNATRVHSRSGVQPLASHTITEFRNYAQNLGNGFQQLDYHYFVLQLLYLVEYADYNSQTKLGLGNTSNTGPIASGGCNSLGMKSGSITNDGKHSAIYRGIEDIFGNIWQFVDGINVQNHQAYINYNPATYQADKFNSDYKKLGYINSNTNGYSSKQGYDFENSLIALPIEINGSESTYITDYYFQATGNRTTIVGGSWGYASRAGLWCWSGDNVSSHVHTSLGARLLKTS